MAVLKCKMCGGDIQATDNTYGTCGSCGSVMTLPKAEDEQKANLFNRANHLRRQNEYDRAYAAYENILSLDPTSAEAHWGLVLSNYGIEYVEDPDTGKRVPTCNRVHREPVLKDADYLATLENAQDEYTKSLYQEEAKQIAEIQKGILAISFKEEPYDVFICYKETTGGGSRTKDSTMAEDLYHHLTKEGWRVFFAKITLEDKLGEEYEPYIYSALHSARVMLVIGTKAEHFNAVWVKNEWSRYLILQKKDRSKLLIPCYCDMDAYEIPEELSHLQSQDMSKVGFTQDIVRGLKKILGTKEAGSTGASASGAATPVAGPTAESMMKRGLMYLEDSEWDQAKAYFNMILNTNPEYAPAYIGDLCAEFKLQKEEKLGEQKNPISEHKNFKKALRFADASYKAKLEGYAEEIEKRIREERELREEQARAAQLLKEQQQRLEKIAREEKEAQLKPLREKAMAHSVCISAGRYHTVRIQTDGTVVATGGNEFDQCKTSGWRNITAVAAGGYHTVGLKADGTVVATGKNDDGQCRTGDWRDIAAVSAGKDHTVGLRADGMVIAAGKNDKGQCNVSAWSDIAAVSAGGTHTLGLKKDGRVVAVGANDRGQCNTTDWKNIVAVCAGVSHTLGLKADGTVLAVGYNYSGQCKTGVWSDIVAVAAGHEHTVGLKADGTVVTLGDNYKGCCNTSHWRDITAVSANAEHTVGLKADGTVAAAGDNSYGQCRVNDWQGIGPVDKEQARRREEIEKAQRDKEEQNREIAREKERVEKQQSAIRRKKIKVLAIVVGAAVAMLAIGIGIVSSVVSGNRKSALYAEAEAAFKEGDYETALKNFGALGSYRNSNDRIFQTTVLASIREKTGKDVSWQSLYNCILSGLIGAGMDYTVGVNADGTVVAVGSNEHGKINVSGWKNMVAVSAGEDHTVGLRADGTVVAIGNKNVASYVSGWKNFTAISAGRIHTAGLRANGTVVEADSYAHGRAYDVDGWKNIIAISAGGYHTVALRADGTAVAGTNNHLGEASVSDWKNLIAVSAGGIHSVGLNKYGNVVVAGSRFDYDNDPDNDDDDKRLEDYRDLSSWKNIVAVSAGGRHTVGLMANGRVVAKGLNDKGQCNVSGWRNIVAVYAGYAHTVGLRSDGSVIATGDNKLGQCNVYDWHIDWLKIIMDQAGRIRVTQ